MRKCLVLAGFCAIAATGCVADTALTALAGQRGVFHSFSGYAGVFVPTNASTEHPRYIVRNRERCGYGDKDGRFTRMSVDARHFYRIGLRLAEEYRRFNDGQAERLAPPVAPENREDGAPIRRVAQAGDIAPD